MLIPCSTCCLMSIISSNSGGNICAALLIRGISFSRSSSNRRRYSSEWPLAAGHSGARHKGSIHTQHGYRSRILIRSPMISPFRFYGTFLNSDGRVSLLKGYFTPKSVFGKGYLYIYQKKTS